MFETEAATEEMGQARWAEKRTCLLSYYWTRESSGGRIGAPGVPGFQRKQPHDGFSRRGGRDEGIVERMLKKTSTIGSP